MISLLFPAAPAAEIERRFADRGAPPVLVVHGDEDVVIPPANADALADPIVSFLRE